MINLRQSIFEWCADHIIQFNTFPIEYATFNDDGSEKEIYKYPDYLKFLTDQDKLVLNSLVNR